MKKIVHFFMFLGMLGFSQNNDFKLAEFFQNSMVIQQEKPINVWGTAQAGIQIDGTFDGENQSTTADSNGNWKLTFSPRVASFDAKILTVNGVEVSDILIGEVWLCAGQSNMGFSVKQASPKVKSVPKSVLNNVRILDFQGLPNVAKNGFTPAQLKRANTDDFFQLKWIKSDIKSIQDQSAVAWFVARELQESLNIPIGVMVVAIGGTAINSYISYEALSTNPFSKQYYEEDWTQISHIHPNHVRRMKESFQDVLPFDNGYFVRQTPYRYMCEPDFLFESSLPKIKYASLRGAVWYQAEGDSFADIGVERYPSLYPMLIQSWRDNFNDANLPFVILQLHRLGKTTFPKMRMVQRTFAAQNENVFLATNIDTGQKGKGHPSDKEKVGKRGAYRILEDIYNAGTKLFPKIKSYYLDGNKLTLYMDNVQEGLEIKNIENPVGSFEVSEDGEVYETIAVTKVGATLQFDLPVDKDIKYMRYLFAGFPTPIVFNSDNLPLAPFVLTLENDPIIPFGIDNGSLSSSLFDAIPELSISVANGAISVEGADQSEVFDLLGRNVGTNNLEPGVYFVRATKGLLHGVEKVLVHE